MTTNSKRNIPVVAAFLAATWLLMFGWVQAQQTELMGGGERLSSGAPPNTEPLAEDTWGDDGPMLGAGGMTQWDYYAGSVYANTSPIWVNADYLLWWISGNSVPALATTSPNGTPLGQAGVLGEPDTVTLFGNGDIDKDARSGFRTSLGVRLGHFSDALMDSKVEASFFWLGDGQSSGNYHLNSTGDPILARPFTDAQTGLEDAHMIAFPGLAMGDMRVQTDSDLLSAGLRFRKAWFCRENARVDWLVGYRYLRHKENLAMEETLISTDPGGAAAIGTEFQVYDEFATWSEFHGLDLGLQWWFYHGKWSAELLTKIAVGSTSQTVEIFGETWVVPPTGTATLSEGGLLAQPSNMGRYSSDEFAILPELGVKLRRRITHSFVLTLGYTVMVVNHVARTGDQIDSTLNLSQAGGGSLVGPARPEFSVTDQDMWIHGFSVGLEW